MNVARRLKALETAAARRCKPRRSDKRSDGEWLATFEHWDREGFFKGEPDVSEALSRYRQALDTAAPQAGGCPAWLWLAELAERVWRGIPAICEAEWRDLGNWLEANRERLPTEMFVPWPDTKPWVQIGVDYLRYFFRDDHRRPGAGAMAVFARRLRRELTVPLQRQENST